WKIYASVCRSPFLCARWYPLHAPGLPWYTTGCDIVYTQEVSFMKLWGGRFSKATDGLVDDFHSSISFDQRLAEQDITGSIAHATMLGEQGIIPQADADKIVAGLRDILADVKAGKITWHVDAED